VSARRGLYSKITKQACNWLGGKLDASQRSQIMFMNRDDRGGSGSSDRISELISGKELRGLELTR